MPERDTFKMTGEDFIGMSTRQQQRVLAALSPLDRRLIGVTARMARLRLATAKAEQRLRNGNLSPEKVERLESKISEYRVSLENLELYRQERAPTGNPVGVDIGVPLATPKLED